MDSTNPFDQKPAPAAPAAAGDTGSLKEARSLWRDFHRLVHEQVALAALEARLAGNSLVRMIVAGVMVAVLLVSVWLGLISVAVLWLISVGVMPSIAILLALAANLAFALMLCSRIRHQSRSLQFPLTVHRLRPAPPGVEGLEKS